MSFILLISNNFFEQWKMLTQVIKNNVMYYFKAKVAKINGGIINQVFLKSSVARRMQTFKIS